MATTTKNRVLENPLSYFDHYGEVDVTKNLLPHWQQDNVFVFVTWRLGDSLPEARLHQWQEDYWDRLIRHPLHFCRCAEYIRENPTRAGLRDGQFILFENVGRGDC